MVKKLRYYARFIVVCLLLNRGEMIKTLMDELKGFIEEYQYTFRPTDAAEWNVVLSEIETFLEVFHIHPGRKKVLASRSQWETAEFSRKSGCTAIE